MITKIWEKIERFLHRFIYKITKVELSKNDMNSLIQFIQFGFVGILNNFICYVIYLILIKMGLHYTVANIIGFSASVFNAHYWNNKYVFSSDKKRIWWKTLLKTYVSYAGTGIILSNILLFLWINICGIPVFIAPLVNLIITIPINFLMNKFWAYKK